MPEPTTHPGHTDPAAHPTRSGLSDARVEAVAAAVLELAVTMRDEVGPRIAELAGRVLAAAGGDAVAAVAVAAALVNVDAPTEAWWQDPPLTDRKRLRPCGTHAAFTRHKQRGEIVDELCRLGEAKYQAERPVTPARREQQRLAVARHRAAKKAAAQLAAPVSVAS